MNTAGVRTVIRFVFFISCVATCLGGYSAPARAEFRFCNQTATQTQVIQGHIIPKKGLTVTGSITVMPGKCGVVVAGKLTNETYFFHASKGNTYYNGDLQLCILTMYTFEIDGEDSPNFRCRLKENEHITIDGVPVHQAMVGFFGIRTDGHSTIIVTERKNKSTFHVAYSG